MTDAAARRSDHPIDPMFINRWSPRAFTGEDISEAALMTLFEAARWAPSASNAQPWRFLYARKGTPHFDTFLGLLIPFNQDWAKAAAALVFLVSNGMPLAPGADKPTPSRTHSLDAGAAWENLALQAHLTGWAAHGMAGIDYPRVATELNVPEHYRVEMAIAIGRQGHKSVLPEALAARERQNNRLPLAEIVMEGGFRV